MPNAFIYIRFSSAKQERGSSQERQFERCSQFIARHGWKTVEPPIQDLGVSAWKGDHLKVGNLGRFAQRVRDGEIEAGSVLVVEHLDRLSRQDPRITQRWLEDITDAGLAVANVSNGRVYDRESLRSATGMMEIMTVLMDAWAAHKHSENLSGRLKESWVKRRRDAEAGIIIGGRIPGWLNVVTENGTKRFQPIPQRVDTVRLIYEMAADGHGQRSIARHLCREGIMPWGDDQHHGRSHTLGWEFTHVADVLASAAVEGDLEPGVGRHKNNHKTGQRIVGYFGAPILDADLIARARASVEGRRGTSGCGRGAGSFTNLFVGLMRCTACGGKMTMRSAGAKSRAGNKSRFMQCANCFGGRGCTETAMFFYQDFEAAALEVVLPLALDHQFFRLQDESRELAIKLAEARKALSDTRDQKNRLLALLMRTEDADVEAQFKLLSNQGGGLERRVAELERDLETARGHISSDEHAKRVMGVREALNDPDNAIRLPARMKVTEALRTVVEVLWCDAKDDFRGAPEKTFTLALVGGVEAFKFVHRGGLIGRVDLAALATDDKAYAAGLLSGSRLGQTDLDRYLKRRSQPAA